ALARRAGTPGTVATCSGCRSAARQSGSAPRAAWSDPVGRAGDRPGNGRYLRARQRAGHRSSRARALRVHQVAAALCRLTGFFFDQLPFLASIVGWQVLLGAGSLALSAGLIACGVPGVLLPISFASGALLGGWTGMAVVVAGAMLGSQALFLVTRVWL